MDATSDDAQELRPATAPGEDRNLYALAQSTAAYASLRPATAPGEDRNDDMLDALRQLPAGCARPLRRARIATPASAVPSPRTASLRPATAPGEDRNAGVHQAELGALLAAPGHCAGRGSQHQRFGPGLNSQLGQLRPATAPGEDRNQGEVGGGVVLFGRCARPLRRARIATRSATPLTGRCRPAAPGHGHLAAPGHGHLAASGHCAGR